MAKKTNNDIAKLTRREQIAYYRWEFLRKNKQYKLDFRNKIPNSKKVLCFGLEGDKRLHSYFAQKYKLYFPIDPKLSFFDIEEIIIKLGKKENRKFKTREPFSMEYISIITAFLRLHDVRIGENIFTMPNQLSAISSPVINSHPIDNEFLHAYKIGKHILMFEKGEYIKLCPGDLSRISLEVDITMPKKEISKAIDKESHRKRELAHDLLATLLLCAEQYTRRHRSSFVR